MKGLALWFKLQKASLVLANSLTRSRKIPVVYSCLKRVDPRKSARAREQSYWLSNGNPLIDSLSIDLGMSQRASKEVRHVSAVNIERNLLYVGSVALIWLKSV